MPAENMGEVAAREQDKKQTNARRETQNRWQTFLNLKKEQWPKRQTTQRKSELNILVNCRSRDAELFRSCSASTRLITEELRERNSKCGKD